MRRRRPGNGDDRGAPQLSEAARAAARKIEIAPSVLPADLARLGQECADLTAAGVDRIQFDVMDGVFVPNLTFGPDVIAACRPHSDVPFEAHLMVVEPDRLAHLYVEAGCEVVIVHAEACPHLHRTLGQIAEMGAKPAVAINPATPAAALLGVLDLVSLVLVMTVNPGFGGQSYISSVEPKIETIRREILEGGFDVDLEVDGGISSATVASAARCGANVLVSGSALFSHQDGLAAAVSELRSLATAAQS